MQKRFLIMSFMFLFSVQLLGVTTDEAIAFLRAQGRTFDNQGEILVFLRKNKKFPNDLATERGRFNLAISELVGNGVPPKKTKPKPKKKPKKKPKTRPAAAGALGQSLGELTAKLHQLEETIVRPQQQKINGGPTPPPTGDWQAQVRGLSVQDAVEILEERGVTFTSQEEAINSLEAAGVEGLKDDKGKVDFRASLVIRRLIKAGAAPKTGKKKAPTAPGLSGRFGNQVDQAVEYAEQEIEAGRVAKDYNAVVAYLKSKKMYPSTSSEVEESILKRRLKAIVR